jgi:hypothetical protein
VDWKGDSELSKQRPLLLQGSLKAEIRNLLSGRVNLAVVVSMDFLPENLLGRFNIRDIFSDTGSNQVVLEPTVRSFDLAFSLGRKSVCDFDVTVLQHLFPLRGGLIGQEVVFSPEGVSSLDKSEDGMRIDIVGEGEAIAKDEGLESLDVSPAGLFLDQVFMNLGHNLRPPLGFQTISLNQEKEAVELSTECYERFEILPSGPPRPTRGGRAKISPLSTPLWITPITSKPRCALLN